MIRCQEKRAKRPDHLPRSKTSGPVVIALEARANGAENGRCWKGDILRRLWDNKNYFTRFTRYSDRYLI